MKKISFFLIICFIIFPFTLYAEFIYAKYGFEEIHFGDEYNVHEEVRFDNVHENLNNDVNNNGNSPAKKPFQIRDRGFEIGIFVNANVANNYLSIEQIFQETIELNLDNLANGFNINLGIGVAPLYFRYNSRKGWGFGLSTVVDASGILGASGKLLSLDEATDEKSDLSGALFASVGIDTFFKIKSLKVRLRPAMYYTLAYIKPDLSYTNNNSAFGVNYDIRIYEAFSLDGFPDNFLDNFKLDASPGFDVSFGLEFPFPYFDIGLDIINIPLLSSSLSKYTQYSGSMGNDELEGLSLGDFFSSFKTDNKSGSGEETVNIDRPFKAFLWVNWRPFKGNPLFTITPLVGFSINQLYVEPFSMEGGLNVCINLGNIFIVKAGVNYMDRLWVNSLNLALNIRVIEVDVGVDIRSQEFAESWKGGGIGVNVGLKFGW
ncbi:MAG: hypothetical protein LBI28_02495 [Treponema sp.]|nr:hypothetical protein [Treponema sp.]